MRLPLTVLLFSILTISCNNNSEKKPTLASNQNTDVDIIQPPVTTVQWLDSTLSFNNIKEGSLVDISFRFVNTGENPLVFSDVEASCGCTIAEKPELPIAPGKQGTIKASFNSSGRLGTNHKTLTAYLNTEEKSHSLTFDVNVISK